MLIMSENNLLSFGLLLMLYQLMVRAAVVKPLTDSVISKQKEVIPVVAANVQNQIFHPPMGSPPMDSSGVPYFRRISNNPKGPSIKFNGEPIPHSSRRHISSADDRYPLDERLPVEDPDYFYYADNPPRPPPPSGDHYRHHPHHSGGPPPPPPHQRSTKKPKKIYKAVERVYYYPDSESGEIARNKDALEQMKAFIPDEPHDEEHDQQDEHEQGDDVEKRKDYGQMYNNPPRGEHEEPEEPEVYETDGSGIKGSIAEDAVDFGKEANDEANRFDKFLNNLRHFEENSEKEYSSPSDSLPNRDDLNFQISDDSSLPEKEEMEENPRYVDSLAAHTGADDRTRDYERVSNYGIPDEYESEKVFYQNQKQEMDGENKGGHRYHKDRRRPRKSNQVSDEEYERRNREVSGLIDSEPEEGDYLSNFDVVKQMKTSEQKYNTGIDPVYSSRRDFDEVTRLEKMIENVALLNKQKEKSASNSHDRNEGREGSESNTQLTKLAKN